MAKNSRVPSAVGAIPVVGDLMKQADTQAQWLQELVEQNARLVGQLPATIKTFNDSLERFNQTVGRLDRMVTQVETATNQLVAPMSELAPRLEKLVSAVDVNSMRELPGRAHRGPAQRSARCRDRPALRRWASRRTHRLTRRGLARGKDNGAVSMIDARNALS